MNGQERRAELAQFLRTRRERISPGQVGLPASRRRRTPGLRREELAQLAGVGATWYTWLEQGRAITASEQMLESLARALQLDADERTYLFVLARQQVPADPLPLTTSIDPALQLILDTMGIYPALILNTHWDILAWNQAACQVLTDFNIMTFRQRHVLWMLFTDQRYRSMLVDWEEDTQRFLALFRASTQRLIGEPWLTELIHDLQEASPEFREWWSHHDVRNVQSGHKRLQHPLAGELTLQAKTFQIADQPDLHMVVYTPVPDTMTATRLQNLGIWNLAHLREG
ncbi:transcriptional regulator [Reticulibacter mediterranei]|uniref:Transcriptional regulator n=1 Tax=Reticulibacter mediterranei TaxID=2778369 RepID=A0A8J3IRY4_9CHLR|nr:helix-turn-helix transcriptional regulator [Reticulibacter mediterranei]GHO99671.1 transcriptional regulator [Reticulibacter mediterranei]